MNNTIIETTDEKPCGNFTVLPMTEPSPELKDLIKMKDEIDQKIANATRIPYEYFRKAKG